MYTDAYSIWLYLSILFTYSILEYFALWCGLLSDTSDNSMQRKCAHFSHSSSIPVFISFTFSLSLDEQMRRKKSDPFPCEGGLCGVLSAKLSLFFFPSMVHGTLFCTVLSLMLLCRCQALKHFIYILNTDWHNRKNHRDEKFHPDLYIVTNSNTNNQRKKRRWWKRCVIS